MKASVLFATKQPFEVCDVVIDKPAAREVLVQIAASGLCHSDYHFANGDLPYPLPAICGHEAAGLVEAIGSEVTAVQVGDHVVACAASFCGQCTTCVSGLNHLCPSKPKRLECQVPRVAFADGRSIHQGGLIGGFAEQMLVHENAIVRLPRELPMDRAALLGCGVVTGLGAVFNCAKVNAGSSVAVIGCGGVGLNVIQGARLSGAEQIIAIDPLPEKRALAMKMGATHVVDSGLDVVAAVKEISNGGVDFSFEVIGLPATTEQAVRMLRPRGLMTVVGAMRADGVIPVPGIAMLMGEWRMAGTYIGSGPFTRDIPRYASLYLKGKLDLDTLVAERIGLDDVNAGFGTMLKATQARSVIVFPDVMARAAAGA